MAKKFYITKAQRFRDLLTWRVSSQGFCVATFLAPFPLLHLRGSRDPNGSGASTVQNSVRACVRACVRASVCLSFPPLSLGWLPTAECVRLSICGVRVRKREKERKKKELPLAENNHCELYGERPGSSSGGQLDQPCKLGDGAILAQAL